LSLPPAHPRKLAHTREVTFHGYQRDDGLWDIEAHMRDTKPELFDIPGERTWQPLEPIHDMQIRLTVDTALVIRDIAVSMNHTPHEECGQAESPMRKMIGCRLGSGWRKAIEENLGNAKGCTHLRELLFNMATAAFQSVTGTFAGHDPDQPPPHLGRCLSWRFDSPLVERRYPIFFKWTPKSKS
jgi:hypothetical protein